MGAAIYILLSKVAPVQVAELAVAILWGALAFAPRERGRLAAADFAVAAAAIAVRWFALDAVMPSQLLAIGIASQCVPRASMLALAWVSTPAGAGPAEKFG